MDLWTSILTAAAAVIVTGLLGFIVIPALRRLKYGQTILDIGPVWHKEKKQGIPTMGGVMFIIGIIVAYSAGLFMLNAKGMLSLDSAGAVNLFKGISGLLLAVFLAFVGFLDDYIKVKKKKNEGLTENQKLVMQVFIVAAYFTSRVFSGDTSTVISFPFLGQLDLWYFYYVVMGLGILFIVNAVNFTDGIDGLCPSVTLVYCAAFMIICNIFSFAELELLSIATAGGCLGFLIWNFYPAKVFMGDTGSMFLGGIVCALGIGAGCEVLMVIAGGVYIWEAVTVLIQRTYFKLTHGKRIFKMTPIHHSFEMRGWKEVKIVLTFSGIGVVLGVIAVLLARGI